MHDHHNHHVTLFVPSDEAIEDFRYLTSLKASTYLSRPCNFCTVHVLVIGLVRHEEPSYYWTYRVTHLDGYNLH